jgi:hypothetical protein
VQTLPLRIRTITSSGGYVILAEPGLLFQRFAQDAGSHGAARANFQMLVTNLIKVKYPDATTVEGPGGRDWGIDTFVGQLARGDVRIWQSKFFPIWNGRVSQDQVRASFKSAVTNAKAKKYTIRRWTLVVPCGLPPDQMKWFDGFGRRNEKETGIAIDMWNGEELRHQLILADAIDVRREYFPHTLAPPPAPMGGEQEAEPVQLPADVAQFEGALFLHQLRAAGRTETDAACAIFYATEALVRDYRARGQATALASMDELHLDVQEIWEKHFNHESSSAPPDGRMPHLVDLVTQEAAACADPPGIFLRPAHKKGTAHRLVENNRAGWVTNWREVAKDHALASPERPTAPVTGAATKSTALEDLWQVPTGSIVAAPKAAGEAEGA